MKKITLFLSLLLFFFFTQNVQAEAGWSVTGLDNNSNGSTIYGWGGNCNYARLRDFEGRLIEWAVGCGGGSIAFPIPMPDGTLYIEVSGGSNSNLFNVLNGELVSTSYPYPPLNPTPQPATFTVYAYQDQSQLITTLSPNTCNSTDWNVYNNDNQFVTHVNGCAGNGELLNLANSLPDGTFYVYARTPYYHFASPPTFSEARSNIFYIINGQFFSSPPPVTVSFNASGDTYIRKGQNNHNYGTSQSMQIQSSGDNRSLVKFDQTAMQSSINGAVLSAKLRVVITDNGNNWGATGRTLDIHRLISNWVEGNGTENDRGTGTGATWNCAIDSIISNITKNCNGSTEWEMGQPNNPNVHPWIQNPTGTKTITNNQTGTVEYDVTQDVASFLSGTNSNYGWVIKKTNENQNGQVSFGSRESSSPPQLIITYQP